MTYDAELAARLRAVLRDEPAVDERPMFGGLAFLVNGHLAVSASGQGGLLLRCEPAQTDELVDPPHVDRFVMRGRPMAGWLRVDASAVVEDDALRRWVRTGLDYAATLPPK